MLFKNIALVFALSAFGLAQEIDSNDVPNQCQNVCNSVVELARSCDQQNNDNDQGERDCICNAQGANEQIPICAACVAQFDNDGSDNDVNDLLRTCAFSTTTFNPSATASASGPSGSNSAASTTPSASGAQTSGPSQSDANASNPTGGATQTDSPAQQSTNAAPAPTMGVAGAGLGLLGFALGMM